jgi:phosphoglycolate phosphatase-like HAD superfamily hydrolase
MYEITPKHKFLVGIDSDGCAFDTMELKHKECFIPNIINSYDLQGISKYTREAAEFVNLYSKDRGVNRFPALIKAFEWLARRPEVYARDYVERVKVPASLAAWVAEETKLGNPALAAKVESSGDSDLRKALDWSEAVNASIKAMVRGVPPFPYVRDCLERLGSQADLLVISATPNEALEAEWAEHDVAKYVEAICGQESGSKKETLANAKHYDADHTLMIGDAPGDYNAAATNQCLFFPINPGAEEISWRRLFEEGIERFFAGAFAGDYQQELLDEFDTYLPEFPPWPVA